MMTFEKLDELNKMAKDLKHLHAVREMFAGFSDDPECATHENYRVIIECGNERIELTDPRYLKILLSEIDSQISCAEVEFKYFPY